MTRMFGVAGNVAAAMAVPIIETATSGEPKTINPRTPAYDPDGDTLSLSGAPTAPAGHGLTVAAGSMVYTAPPSFSGDATLGFALRDPAGKISSSVARVTVKLPDAPVTGFDPALPLGGLGVGVPCLWGQPGNQRQQSNTFQGMLFRMERTGNITAIQWNNRFNHGAQTDYSGGDGGVIYWDLRRVIGTPTATDDAVMPLTLDSEVAGRTDAVTGPFNPSAFAAAWTDQGGSGSVPQYFHEFPTLKLQSPVAVTAGEWVLFRHMQTAGSSTRSISVNNCYSTRRSLTDYSPYRYGEARMYRAGSTSTVRWEHYPILLYGFADGFVAGWGGYGYATGEAGVEERIFVGQGALIRQVIPMPAWANGRAIKTVHVGMARLDNTATADIVLRIRSAGGSPGGAGDNGSILASRTLSAAGVEYVPNLKTTVSGATLADNRPVSWLRFNFTTSPADVRITGGSSYYFEVATTSATGTRYQGHQMMRSCDLAPRGLKNASYLLPGMRGQRNPGSGWSNLTSSGVLHDAPMFVEFG